MNKFIEAFGSVNDFINSISDVPSALGTLVKEIPLLSFGLGVSVVLAFATWFIKMASR